MIIHENPLEDMLVLCHKRYKEWQWFKANKKPNISGMRIIVWFEDGTQQMIETGVAAEEPSRTAKSGKGE